MVPSRAKHVVYRFKKLRAQRGILRKVQGSLSTYAKVEKVVSDNDNSIGIYGATTHL